MKYGRAKHPLEVQMKAMTTRAVLRDIRGLSGCTMAMYLFKGHVKLLMHLIMGL